MRFGKLSKSTELPGCSGKCRSISSGRCKSNSQETLCAVAAARRQKRVPRGRPLSPKTVRHIAVLMHGCFEKARMCRIVARNPMDGVVLPKLTRKPPRVVEKDAAKKLLQRARDTRLYPFIILGLATRSAPQRASRIAMGGSRLRNRNHERVEIS